METRELLKKVRQVEIKTRGMVNQIFSGEYHCVFKGRGMEFSEVREYQFGDDIRHDRLECLRAVRSAVREGVRGRAGADGHAARGFQCSGDFGSAVQLKNEIAAEICAVLAFSAIKNNDKVGLIMFTDRIEKFVPPKKGRAHILRIIRELLAPSVGGTGTNIRGALEYFNHVSKKRTIAFLISDFIDDGYDKILGIVGTKHDVIAVQVTDPREETLPDVGMVYIRDAETGRHRWVDSGNRGDAEAFEKFWDERRAAQKSLFLRRRVDAIPIRIDRPYIKPIVDFFRLREKRM